MFFAVLRSGVSHACPSALLTRSVVASAQLLRNDLLLTRGVQATPVFHYPFTLAGALDQGELMNTLRNLALFGALLIIRSSVHRRQVREKRD